MDVAGKGPYTNFRNLDNRRATFEHWPNEQVCPDELSRAGFYYTGRDDKTICAYCQGTAHNWKERDEPLLEHARLYPACPFILNPPDYGMKDDTLQELPNNSNMTSYRSRLNSFETGWFSAVKPARLVPAGFYYIGFSDVVICFQCGLCLNNWLRKDDPFEEHTRWNSSCPLMLHLKGQDYVTRVKNKHLTNLLEKYHQYSTDLREPSILPDYIAYSLQLIMKGGDICFYVSKGIPVILIEKILKKFMLDNERGFVSKDEIGKLLATALSIH
jgi:hypothetical protein